MGKPFSRSFSAAVQLRKIGWAEEPEMITVIAALRASSLLDQQWKEALGCVNYQEKNSRPHLGGGEVLQLKGMATVGSC